MFHKWGFLLSEIWVLLALAALLGLFVGWMIWGRREVVIDTSEADRLRAELATCNSRGTDLSKRLTAAEARAAEFEARAAHAAERAAAERFVAAAPKASMTMPVMAKPAALAKPVAKAKPAANEAPAAAEPAAGTKAKPKGLSAAREGKADDLKLVKGIGPKLEILCNKLGFYHFDQIANWTASEIAWVDDNLEGFKGRVTRDEWVVQARDLAAGKPPRAGGEN